MANCMALTRFSVGVRAGAVADARQRRGSFLPCVIPICQDHLFLSSFSFVARYVDGIMEQGEGTSSQPKPGSKKACERNQLHPEGASSQAAPASKKACARKLTLNLK
uniref:Uncharacterized protein n=1 Tax=Oryza rufipogon TaxID=4529 RepID=A0A0E0PXQ5_ORYRU